MRDLMNVMMLSCVKATQLVEMKEHVPLKIIEKMQLQIHVAMCSGCKNYMKQTKLINMLLNKNFESLPKITETGQLESAIIDKLKN